MSEPAVPRVLSIPCGTPFLPVLVEALLDGRLVSGFPLVNDPLSLADATIFVPTRRAARALTGILAERLGGRAALLPAIRPLGDVDEDAITFEPGTLDLPPPISTLERILLLAPLVRAWRTRLPAHIEALFEEQVTVPTSLADSIWLSRDLAALMDEIETEGADWTKLSELAPGDLSGWWQVTLDFLSIVTNHWPAVLADLQRTNPAAHRNALLAAETERLRHNPPVGPVIAAGSTGSIPATARLLSAIARLPQGAVVLPGLDKGLDDESWSLIGQPDGPASIRGHTQYGLRKLIDAIGVDRSDVVELARPKPPLAARSILLSEAMRPAETTDSWSRRRSTIGQALADGALDGVTLIEAASERDEALAIALVLRTAAGAGHSAALVTGDRPLARRVSAELLRFGIRADDSAGQPLASSPPAVLLRLLVQCALAPGDPVAILALLKHPLTRAGTERTRARAAVETIELVALRGGTGRPDITTLEAGLDSRLNLLAGRRRPPAWYKRMTPADLEQARGFLARLQDACAPLTACRRQATTPMAALVLATIQAFEAIGSGPDGDLSSLYDGDAGSELAVFLRGLLGATAPVELDPTEWPQVLAALLAPERVKPAMGADSRVAVWGPLEARLQTVHTLVVGGLNEGSWPGKAEADRFMSRTMKGTMSLEPPERRIGLAAHDFMMAMGAENVVLARSARTGDSPAVASRWLQRLVTCGGEEAQAKMRARGDALLSWVWKIDMDAGVPFAERPRPAPPLEARPRQFSVTEIETLRRDPYAVYARRILALEPLEPLIRDPGAAERGSLFHEILHRFVCARADVHGPDASDRLIAIGRQCFDEADLPADVEAVWWPRFVAMSGSFVNWERSRSGIKSRFSELAATATPVGSTGTTLSGFADRIDLREAGGADILDYKTGSSPSRGQAHTLLAPQLALEGALLRRSAFASVGPAEPVELAYVRLKGDGQVFDESVLQFNNRLRSAPELSEEAWSRLDRLLNHYNDPANGYLSRALPFREGDTDGTYDHLARVLEWSAGADNAEDED